MFLLSFCRKITIISWYYHFINLNFSFQAAVARKKAFLVGKEVNSFCNNLSNLRSNLWTLELVISQRRKNSPILANRSRHKRLSMTAEAECLRKLDCRQLNPRKLPLLLFEVSFEREVGFDPYPGIRHVRRQREQTWTVSLPFCVNKQ